MILRRLVKEIKEGEGYVRLDMMVLVEMVENESGASIEEEEILDIFGFNV